MITGQVKSYDFRFGDDFGDFLQSVDRATVTYNVDPVEVDQKLNDTADVRFNLYPTVGKYITSLSKGFTNSCNDIERMADDMYVKSEKLNLLSRFIIEVEACQNLLSLTTDKKYTHPFYFFYRITLQDSIFICLF